MSQKQADIFLTYCTNAVLAKKDVPNLQIVKIPESVAVGADYGLIVKVDATVPSWKLAMYILSPKGKRILNSYGFETHSN